MSVRVKICGLTNRDDALHALKSGADYLGFIMVPETPRYVSVAKVKKIVSGLPKTGRLVGVFMNHQPDDVVRILDETGLDIAQLHGKEDEVFCEVCWAGSRLEGVACHNSGAGGRCMCV